MAESRSLNRLRTSLRRGRRDYDSVAGIVYAACYKDPYVLPKILTADPADVPSSGEEDAALSDEEYSTSEAEEDVVPESEKAVPAEASGSREDPVVLDENVDDDNRKQKSRKCRRPASEVDDESAKRPPELPDTLLYCLNCGAKFNPNKNKENACQFHPEPTMLMELEDNPTCEDIEDDEDSRETWPNALQWECCESNFEQDEPCESGKHRANEGEKTEYARRHEKERRDKRYFG